ncbi:MAG: tyrosine-type recombinase/integrase [Bacillota bacterium]
MSLDLLLEQFRKSIDKSKSGHTVAAYMTDLALFINYACEKLGKDSLEPEDITNSLIMQYEDDLDKKKLSPRTINRKLASLRSFFKYVIEVCEIEMKNPTKNIEQANETKDTIPSYITPEEGEMLLAAARETRFPERDYALVLTFLTTGLRVEEMCQLDIGKIDFISRVIKVKGKGNKERQLLLIPRSIKALQDYLATRKDNYPALFVSQKTKLERGLRVPSRFTRSGVFRLVKKLAGQVGLEEKLTPHVLRHSCATQLYLAGVDILAIKEILGHANVSTTQIYTKVIPKHLEKAFAKHPMNN